MACRHLTTIRLAEPAERAALEELQRRSSMHGSLYREQLAADPDVIELPEAQIAAGCVRVAEQDGVVVGFSVILERRGDGCELDGLFVEPDRMRSGIGRLLVEDATQIARRRGASRIDVVANPQALAFYAAVGFTAAGEAQTRFGPAPRMSLALDATTEPRALPRLGFGLPVSGPWATPATIRRIARRAEARGYASLWTFQRVLSPVGRELGRAHRSVLDPVTPLAYVAGCTERIRLGTATICAPFTPPAVLAKSLTSLDVLSGGRLTVGLGMGWMPQEYAAAGVPYERRGARMDEYLRCLEAIWTQDPVEFAGDFYTVPRSHVGPPPVQRPHPPVLLGGAAEPALRRAGRLAQGWIAASSHDLAGLDAAIATVRAGAREAGRDPDAVQVVVRGIVELHDDDPGPQRMPLHGTRLQVLDDLAGLRAQGVTEVFLDLNLSPQAIDLEDAERVLDAFAPATRRPRPSA